MHERFRAGTSVSAVQSAAMVNKCAAVGCRTGYLEQEPRKTRLFRFPLENAELLEQWLGQLKRADFRPSEHSRLCALHFDEGDFETVRRDSVKKRAESRSPLLKRIRLKPGAYPTLFPDLPSYLLRKEKCAAEKGMSSSTENRQTESPDSEPFADDDDFSSDPDLVRDLEQIDQRLDTMGDMFPSGFIAIKQSDLLCFILLESSENPKILASLVVKVRH